MEGNDVTDNVISPAVVMRKSSDNNVDLQPVVRKKITSVDNNAMQRLVSEYKNPSALEVAVTEFDDNKVTELLEDPEASVTQVNHDGRNVLHEMVCKYASMDYLKRAEVKNKFIVILSKLLEKGLDINSAIQLTPHGGNLQEIKYTALHLAACSHDCADIVRALFSSGGKVNAEDGHKQTPLHLATDSALIRNVEALLDGGADPDYRDEYGKTPLHWAVKGRHRSMEIVKLLLGSAANPNVEDTTGSTPVHLAAKYGNHKLLQELLQHGGSVNVTDGTGQSAVHYACAQDCSGLILKCLLEANADVKIQDSVAMETPLHKAAIHHMSENLLTLCNSGLIDTNTRDILGETALHKAARFGDWAMWAALLQCNGDIHIENNLGVTPLKLLKRHKNRLLYLIERYHLEDSEW